jgi:hypothetical protein
VRKTFVNDVRDAVVAQILAPEEQSRGMQRLGGGGAPAVTTREDTGR